MASIDSSRRTATRTRRKSTSLRRPNEASSGGSGQSHFQLVSKQNISRLSQLSSASVIISRQLNGAFFEVHTGNLIFICASSSGIMPAIGFVPRVILKYQANLDFIFDLRIIPGLEICSCRRISDGGRRHTSRKHEGVTF